MTSQVSTLEQPRQAQQAAKAAAPRGAVKSNGHDVALSGKKARITIHPSDSDGGQDAVFIGLNGFAYQLPRGESMVVPVELLSILENAIAEKVIPGSKGEPARTSQAPRYAYTVHDTDFKEAVEA